MSDAPRRDAAPTAGSAPGEPSHEASPDASGPVGQASPGASEGTSADPSADPRADRVAAAVRTWQRELVELGGRNTLLWHRDLPTGTLDLTTAHPGGVSMLLAGRRTRLSHLFREPAALDEARRRARAIRAKALELHEERGLVVGFVAVGMATWSVPRAARPPVAPVLLRTCVLRPTTPVLDDFDIDLGAEVELNPVLREYLRSEQGLEIDGARLADLAVGESGFDPQPAFAALRRQCAAVPEFTVAPRIVLGTFSHAKLPMVADLALQGGTLADHDVVAALAGDPAARAAVRVRVPDSLADADPDHEHLVLDTDAAQQSVVEAVRAGAHLLVTAPPGTGSTQTVAALVAALAAEGRSTLYVSQKRASVEALADRLDGVGLGSLLLDASDASTEPRATLGRVVRALDAALAHEDAPLDTSTAAPVRRHRARLQEHLRSLHDVRRPWGVSAHDAQQALVELASRRPAPTSRVRLDPRALATIDRERAVELGRRLRDVAGLGAWVRDGDDPWFGARILTPEDASRALDVATKYSSGGLDAAGARLDAVLAESNVPPASSVADWSGALATMEQVRDTLEVFRPEVFDLSLTEHIAATATRDWREARDVDMGRIDRWRVRRQTARLLRPGRPPADLHERLVAASEQRAHWYGLVGGGGRPEISPRLDEGLTVLADLVRDLTWLDERLPSADEQPLTALPLDALRARLRGLAGRPDRVTVLPHVTGILDDLRAAGLGGLVDDLSRRGVATEHVTAETEHVWWASVVHEIAERDPSYGSHDGGALSDEVDAFAAADLAHQAATATRVRDTVAAATREAVAEHPEQEQRLRAEAARTRGRSTLRDLVPHAPGVLTAALPCWAMSPLAVASTLPPGRWFDVVVLDEASRLTPATAVSAVSRARQVVVVGDARQLPPTGFSTVADDGDPIPVDATAEPPVPSLVDALAEVLPERRLTGQHRARDERLLEPVVRGVYGAGLVTVPGTAAVSPLVLERVDGQATLQPGVDTIESTDAEVERVVELVVEHARRRPRESLAVVALNAVHARRIERAVAEAVRRHRDLSDVFEPRRRERFVVLDVEQAQGDTRDAVIVAVGFGKTPHGRVLHRFGSLSLEGGERRLTVALTRSRTRTTVVSALGSADLDPERLRAPGALMLRDVLAHLESAAPTGPAPAREQPASRDPLVRDLAARLRSAGLTVHEDHGTGERRIDLVVEDPYRRGRGLVAVETDGDRYAALPSTRERDRLRPEQLTRLGWVHERVWSTDVFRDPAREVSRIVALARAGAPPTPEPVVEPVATTTESTDRAEAESPSSAHGAAGSSEGAADASSGADQEVASAVDPKASDVDPKASDASGEPRRKRGRRRVFRRGTADSASADPLEDLTPSTNGARASDDSDTGWGGAGSDENAGRDRWLQEQRPPHYE